MTQLTKFWAHANISRRWKLKVYRMMIVPILTYGLYLESLNPAQLAKLEGHHIKFVRRVMGIKTTYYTEVVNPAATTVTNKEVLERARMYTITAHIKADQMKLYGHILRSPHTDLMKNVSFTAAGAIRGHRENHKEAANAQDG